MSIEASKSQAFDEICQFSGYTTAPEQGAWLVKHGMLPTPNADYTLITEQPWEMPGSEAYVMRFAIQSADGTSRQFVAKHA
jgi:hypothetical protein